MIYSVWGPVYGRFESELTILITRLALVAKPKLTASKFMEQVIADLEEVAGLLKDYDPAMEASGMLNLMQVIIFRDIGFTDELLCRETLLARASLSLR